MDSDPAEERTFTWADLERWAEDGLIDRSQLAAIRAATEADPAGPASPVAPPRETRAGFNLITVVYYVGAFLILFAFTTFMGLQWEDLSEGARLAVSLLSALGLVAVGFGVRRAGYETAGGLLVFAGVGITPLVVYSFQVLTGTWPESGTEFQYEDFYDWISSSWLVIEVVSIGVALLALWWTRVPLLMLLVAFWLWFLSMDASRAIAGDDEFDWSDTERVLSIFFGLATLGVGIALQGRNLRPYAFWLYVFGHLMLFANLANWALDDDAAAAPIRGLVFLAVYVIVVAASVWLQSRVFLVFGALGVYCYVGYLAFEIFEDTLGFTFTLAFIGLLLIGGAIAFQRWFQPWWAGRAAAA